MYEETRKIQIDWKSLIIKIIILLIVLCLIIWITSLFKKDDKKSNLSDNLIILKDAAKDYFVESRLPIKVNGKVKITLGEMIKQKLLIEIVDQNGKTCSNTESYAEVTKINDEDYNLKVKLVCDKESDYIIDNIKVPKKDDTNNVEDNNKEENQEPDTNNEPTSNNTPTTKPNNQTNTSNNKPNNKPTVNNDNNTSNNNDTVTCKYGSKDYYSVYPLAYIIDGNCAISREDYYDAIYANIVTEMGAVEYKKITDEISNISKEINANLYVEAPIYNGIYNFEETGLVGYQIKFIVQAKETYGTRVVYEYYLNQNGERTVTFDNLGSLKSSELN